MRVKLKPIERQVVVVFGASSGIGRETARRFGRRGARVVVSARGKDGLDSLVDSIHERGGHAIAVPAEVTDFAQVKHVAEEAVRHFGALDTWVHCAAVELYATFEQTTPEEWRRVVDVNLNGQAYGAMAALQRLRESGGALISVSSVEANRSMPLQSAYAASKHGLKGMLDTLRLELQAEGAPVSVTNVMPAGINTPLFNKARTKMGVKPMPMPPIYEPESVADVILYAAEHPVAEIYAGGASKFMTAGQAVAPRVMDRVLMRVGFSGQKSEEVKGQDAPDNLFEAVAGHDRVSGDFGAQARRTSVYNWLETHPASKLLLAGSAIGAVSWLAARNWRER